MWFRLDLRLADQPALQAAVESGAPVIPILIFDPAGEVDWEPGAASNWWLHQSLVRLDESLRKKGSRLVIRKGDSLTELRKIVAETGARAVYWNRRYEPAITARDSRVKSSLQGDGLEVASFNGSLLNEPWTIQNKSGRPFKVFTPYWKTCLAGDFDPLISTPKEIPAPSRWPRSLTVGDLMLEPLIDWTGGMRQRWEPGEKGATKALGDFVDGALADYGSGRNVPGTKGTSRLSPHLHFGEISPRQIVDTLRRKSLVGGQFLAEVGWREFAYHLLFHFPHTTDRPLREEFERFSWRSNPEGLRAWQQGMTGFPIVDAGMRELWHTGWMHNRVRMIVASFLVKDLMIPWQEGAKWFWDTLVDADLAANTLGWQWTAGCGADAAPFFRVFNPTSQGEKFDTEGDYVRRWVPELKKMPNRWLHQPWNASGQVLADAAVVLGETYPEPVVSHSIAREVALEAFRKLKN